MSFFNVVFQLLDETEHQTRRQVDLQLLIDTRAAIVHPIISNNNAVEVHLRRSIDLEMLIVPDQNIAKVQEIICP